MNIVRDIIVFLALLIFFVAMSLLFNNCVATYNITRIPAAKDHNSFALKIPKDVPDLRTLSYKGILGLSENVCVLEYRDINTRYRYGLIVMCYEGKVLSLVINDYKGGSLPIYYIYPDCTKGDPLKVDTWEEATSFIRAYDSSFRL